MFWYDSHLSDHFFKQVFKSTALQLVISFQHITLGHSTERIWRIFRTCTCRCRPRRLFACHHHCPTDVRCSGRAGLGVLHEVCLFLSLLSFSCFLTCHWHFLLFMQEQGSHISSDPQTSGPPQRYFRQQQQSKCCHIPWSDRALLATLAWPRSVRPRLGDLQQQLRYFSSFFPQRQFVNLYFPSEEEDLFKITLVTDHPLGKSELWHARSCDSCKSATLPVTGQLSWKML